MATKYEENFADMFACRKMMRPELINYIIKIKYIQLMKIVEHNSNKTDIPISTKFKSEVIALESHINSII